jgi:hypothetical protein
MKLLKQLSFVVVVLIVAAGLVVGCASIMKGSKQNIALSSSPSPANVVVKTTGGVNVFEGQTPTTVRLAKNKEYIVTVTLPGYKDATASVSKDGIEGWFWGNILCGGIIGIIVDASNGAMNKLGPDQVNIQLSTAYLPGQEKAVYAVVHGRDSQGQLRHLAIPLLEDKAVDFSAAN